MKIIIENTSKIIHLNGVPARIWEGETESGIKVLCYVTRIAVDRNEGRVNEFESELKKEKVPSPEVQAIPLRMII